MTTQRYPAMTLYLNRALGLGITAKREAVNLRPVPDQCHLVWPVHLCCIVFTQQSLSRGGA